MKRQIISSIAAVSVIVTALTGCSENKENSSQSTSTSSSTTSSESSSTTTTTESSTETKESSSATVESSVSTSELAPEPTSEPAPESVPTSEPEVVKKTITLDDGFGDIEVPLENKGVNKYLQQIYDKGIIPEGTYAGTEILINEEGTEACIIFSGNSVNHGNVPVYDFGFTTDWEPTPIEEDDKIWEEVIVPDQDRYVEKNQKGEIKFVDLNKNGTAQNWEVSVHSILSSDAFELRGIIYL